MTVTSFPTLLTIEITHSYYDGRCRDFAFVMDQVTKRLAGRGRLMVRELDGVLHVLYEADESGVPIAAIAGETMHIGLKLRNSTFANFTNLPAGVPPRNLAYTNTQNARALDIPSQFAFAGDVFTYAVTTPDRPVNVVVIDATGVVAAAGAVGAGENTASFDLRAMRRGPFTVEERVNAAVTTSGYYLDAELRGDDVFAIAHIKIASDFYGNPPAFTISYRARVDRLRFYIVAQNHSTADLADLKVEDAGPVNPDLPPASIPPAITFAPLSAAAVTADAVASSLKAGTPDSIAVFESATDVPRRQRALRRLHLMRKDQELIANLRHPGADQSNAALIIHVAKP